MIAGSIQKSYSEILESSIFEKKGTICLRLILNDYGAELIPTNSFWSDLEKVINDKKVAKIILSYPPNYNTFSSETNRLKLIKSLVNILKNSQVNMLEFFESALCVCSAKLLFLNLKHTNLVNLNVEIEKFDANGSKWLLDGLIDSKIKTLKLTKSLIDKITFKYFAQGLRRLPLKQLCFDSAQLDEQKINDLSQGLAASSLEILTISRNSISDTGMKTLSRGLVKSDVKALKLIHNKLSDTAVKSLSEKLCDTKLETLIINHNQIDDEAAKTILMGLKSTNIRCVDLSHNCIQGNKGSGWDHLLDNTNLQTLILQSNHLNSTGFITFGKVLLGSNVRRIDFGLNQIGDRRKKDVEINQRRFETPQSPLFIEEFSRRQRQEHASFETAEFSKYLSLSSVTHIKMNRNHIGPSEAKQFIKGLKCTKVIVVHLGWTRMDKQDLEQILTDIKETRLIRLNLYPDKNITQSPQFQEVSRQNFWKTFALPYYFLALVKPSVRLSDEGKKIFLEVYFNKNILKNSQLEFSLGILRKLPEELSEYILRFVMDPYIPFDLDEFSPSFQMMNQYRQFIGSYRTQNRLCDKKTMDQLKNNGSPGNKL